MMNNREIGFLINQISRRIRMHVDGELNGYALTLSQLQLLQCIENAGGETTQKEIERQLRVSHPTVVGLISRLEKNGYVVTQAGTGKQKSKQVSMTCKGRDQWSQLEARRIQTEQQLLKGFSGEEREILREMLVRLSENIKDGTKVWADVDAGVSNADV